MERSRPFRDVPEDSWRDWRWQHRHALRSAEALAAVIALTPAERRGLAATAGAFRVAVTPYYASLIDPEHPFCPIRMQAVPVAAEAERFEGDLRDPLGEDHTRPVRAVVHRYPDRALLLVADSCAVYCRHCTRRRITGGEEGAFDRAAVEEGLAYVRAHREVRDVLVSGGDPLALGDDRLAWVLRALRAIPHVEILRLATRAPVTCPMRVTDALARLLREVKPLFAVTHFNHPKECTPEAQEACERLVDHGVPVENQTVLLRRVNSSARTIADLNHRLLAWRVRPYYLHQGDVAEGTAHLRTPLACGLEILERLRGHTSGLAVPHLAVDLPGGGGKVTLQPEYRLGRADGGTAFRNWQGRRFVYPDPPETDCSCPYDDVFYPAARARPPEVGMIAKVLEALAVFTTGAISTLGYGGVVLLMAIESACVPLPSEIIMPFAGSLVYAGRFTLHGAALAGAVGCIVGSIPAYYLGQFGGRPLIERWGRYVLLSHRELDLADRLFARHGQWVVLVGRLLPVVRTFIAFPAGVARMNMARFIVFTFVGSYPWCYGLAWVGMKLGEQWDSDPRLKAAFHRFDLAIGVLIVVCAGGFVWHKLRERRAAGPERA